MTDSSSQKPAIQIYPALEIPSQPFWPALHHLYNHAYKAPPGQKDWPLPQPFLRLYPDLERASPCFTKPLGKDGFVAVSLLYDAHGNQTPAAAASAMPFEGLYMADGSKVAWANAGDGAEEGHEPHVWEFNHVATAAEYRGRGLSSGLVKVVEDEVVRRCKAQDGDWCRRRVRMIARTVEVVSGDFWRKRGYVNVEELRVVLPKGFTHMQGYNGLPGDLVLTGGEKWLT